MWFPENISPNDLVIHLQSPLARWHAATHVEEKCFCCRSPISLKHLLNFLAKKRRNAPYFCDGVRHRGFVVNLCDFDEAFRHPEETLASDSAFGGILAIPNPDPLKAPVWSTSHNQSAKTWFLTLLVLVGGWGYTFDIIEHLIFIVNCRCNNL